MYKIRKEFSFCASHQLNCLPEGHPCTRLHGHNYVVTVELVGSKLNDAGMLQDYRELDDIKQFLDNAFDHKNLNDFLPYNPTAENMARHFFAIWKTNHPLLYAVEVSETPKTSARYEE